MVPRVVIHGCGEAGSASRIFKTNLKSTSLNVISLLTQSNKDVLVLWAGHTAWCRFHQRKFLTDAARFAPVTLYSRGQLGRHLLQRKQPSLYCLITLLLQVSETNLVLLRGDEPAIAGVHVER